MIPTKAVGGGGGGGVAWFRWLRIGLISARLWTLTRVVFMLLFFFFRWVDLVREGGGRDKQPVVGFSWHLLYFRHGINDEKMKWLLVGGIRVDWGTSRLGTIAILLPTHYTSLLQLLGLHTWKPRLSTEGNPSFRVRAREECELMLLQAPLIQFFPSSRDLRAISRHWWRP